MDHQNISSPSSSSNGHGSITPCNEKTETKQETSSPERALTNCQRLCYSVGHVYNDLTASMWFNYLLLYLIEVEKFENNPAGYLILIGHVAGAFFTPLIGFESDRTKKGIRSLGTRKTWHLIGNICVFLTFPFIFEPCINCSHASSTLQIIYYAPFIIIFQFGWSTVQINHLSYASELTPYKHERVILQSMRNFFIIFANISVFGMFSVLFKIGSDDSSSTISAEAKLVPADAPKFRNLTFFCLGMGILFNAIFYIGTSGVNVASQKKDQDAEGGDTFSESMELPAENGIGDTMETPLVKRAPMTWKDWLKEHQFYQVGLLYMFTCCYYKVRQVYFGIYLTRTIMMNKIFVALMPLFTYSANFLSSALAPIINKTIGRKMTYFVGVLFGISANVWLFFMAEGSNQVYGAAIFLGIADSMMFITSLSMGSDLIAGDVESGAFVFGVLTFTDKLSTGLAIVAIEKFDPCGSNDCSVKGDYYRYAESMFPGGAVLAGFIVLLTLIPQTIGVRRNRKHNEQRKLYS